MTEEDHQAETTTMPQEDEQTTLTTGEEEPLKSNISWADDDAHYLGGTSTFSTRSDCSAGDLPLSPKFSEEGSSGAAVMDEHCQILDDTTPSTGRLSGTDTSIQEVRHNTHLQITDSAQDCTSVSRDKAEEASTLTTEVTMGTKVIDAGDANNVVSRAILQDSPNGEEEEGETALKEYTNEDAIAQGVLVSPSLGDNLIDQVCLARSVSNDSEDNLVLASTYSDDAADGIIMPPSMSPPKSLAAKSRVVTPDRTPKSTTITTTNNGMKYIQVYTDYSASQLMSLPIDSLHCVASFLTPLEWAQYGQTCSSASKICREIFRRVRMHGFRCATEVVSAWKLDQHADARELAALYISSGVPIYPFAMGHSYHTVCWRMGVEAKSMEERAEAAAGDNRPSDQSTDGEEENTYAVDRYFNERNQGTRDVSHVMCSYLEDKCMYTLGPTQGTAAGSPMAAGRWHSMAVLPNLQRELGLAADPLGLPPAIARVPDPRPLANLSPLSSAASSPARSLSQSDLRAKNRAPKATVQVHRHLLDQHLLGRSCVDDEGGDMKTPSISLSADFFHPHLCVHSISTHSRPLGAPNTPRKAAVASTHGAEENLLEDPAFQAWAARAAASVHTRQGGAHLDDREELAELQTLYTQLFTSDRNTASPAATADENVIGDATGSQLLPAPVQPAPAVRSPNSLTSSFDDLSTLHPRHGYSSIFNSVDLEVYSASSANAKDKSSDLKRQLRTRYTFYQRRVEVLLSHGDSSGYEECMMDFWDEFFPLTSKIHYYDRHTAVPRISCLQQFLTQPCPKEIGIVQCEIERVKISSKKRKGVSMKGRLFPTYEYRLFIKDRQHGKTSEEGDNPFEEDNGARRDTVMMVAKNRGRKHVDTSGVVSLTPAAKKGANNYYLYTPQQADVDTHYNAINETEEEETGNINGVSLSTPPSGAASPVLLGRLQSNFIGTEFQIYTPKLRKSLPGRRIRRSASLNESPSSFDEDADYDSGFASDTGTPSRRRSRFGRLTLRRNSSHVASPSSSDGMLSPSSTRSRSRSRSRQETPVVRAPRMNRRAIANATEETPDGESELQLNQEPFLCEEEDGVITYTANLLGSRPRIMDVCIPKLMSDGQVGGVWRNYLENHEEPDECAPYNRMLNCFKQVQQRLESQNANENADRPNEENSNEEGDDFGLLALQNRPPWWNIELGSFVLNFRGRVSVASVKNFQLCDRNDHDHIMLQFGRISGRHSFTMDYQYPLTAVQAFSIAISSLQSKISFG